MNASLPQELHDLRHNRDLPEPEIGAVLPEARVETFAASVFHEGTKAGC
jgi:hypothetical protein